MKDHGVTPEAMYPTMNDKPKPIYPFISLPADAFEKSAYQPGHKCMLKIEVEIDTMSKDRYECKLLKSEEIDEKKD